MRRAHSGNRPGARRDRQWPIALCERRRHPAIRSLPLPPPTCVAYSYVFPTVIDSAAAGPVTTVCYCVSSAHGPGRLVFRLTRAVVRPLATRQSTSGRRRKRLVRNDFTRARNTKRSSVRYRCLESSFFTKSNWFVSLEGNKIVDSLEKSI